MQTWVPEHWQAGIMDGSTSGWIGVQQTMLYMSVLHESSIRKSLNTLIIFWQPRDFAVLWLDFTTVAMEILCLLCFLNWQTLLELNLTAVQIILLQGEGICDEWLPLVMWCHFPEGLYRIADVKGGEALKNVRGVAGREGLLSVIVTHLYNVPSLYMNIICCTSDYIVG